MKKPKASQSRRSSQSAHAANKKGKRIASKARCAPRKVTIKNASKGLTSQAGLVPVIKFLQKFNVLNLIEKAVPVERGANAVYGIGDAVFLTLIGLIGGACYLDGVVAIWADSVIRQIAGYIRIPDATTLGRLFKVLVEGDIAQLEELNHIIRGRIWKYSFRSGVLSSVLRYCMLIDVDSTVKTVYGKQEGADKGYNPGKRGKLSYHPLLAFSAETKEILQGWLRCGSAYTSNGIVEFLKQLLAHLPNKVRIVLRGDSGFFSGELLGFLESLGHGYLIKVKLRNLVGLLEKQVWTPVPGHPSWEQCEFWYACNGWKTQRRFVAVRVRKEEESTAQMKLFEIKEYKYFCYVVSEELTPWQTHKKYGQRATCETWIDEAKNQMGLAHIKTGEFIANAALFQCAILAYNTIRWMARCSGNVTLRSWEIQTVRTFLVRVAGKLVKGSRQLQLNTPKSHLYPAQWSLWVALGFT